MVAIEVLHAQSLTVPFAGYSGSPGGAEETSLSSPRTVTPAEACCAV